MQSIVKSKILFGGLFVLLAVNNACNKASHNSQPPNSQSSGAPQPNPLASPRAGYYLFETHLSSAEVANQKRDFLDHVHFVNEARGTDAYGRPRVQFTLQQVGDPTAPRLMRGEYGYPNTPIVHTYHSVGTTAPLVVRFSDSFRWNLPDQIIDTVSQYDVDGLDIFFTPQTRANLNSADVSLKAGYWMFPNRPRLDEIIGSPPEYNKTVLLGLHDADHNIDHHVVSNQLHPFQVILHDGLVSPNTGHIAFLGVPAGSFSFYSIAVFEEQRRAAVTLHWILSQVDLDGLSQHLRQVAAAGNHLQVLIDALNADGNFQGTPMLQKLINLARP